MIFGLFLELCKLSFAVGAIFLIFIISINLFAFFVRYVSVAFLFIIMSGSYVLELIYSKITNQPMK